MTQSKTMAIQALGMISCLADTAEGNAALMRCNYDGFSLSNFLQPLSPEAQIVGEVEQYKDIRGLDLLLTLSVDTVKDIQQQHPNLVIDKLPILVCLPALERFQAYTYPGFESDFFTKLLSSIGVDNHHPQSSYIFSGRAGIGTMLQQAQQLIAEGNEQVLIISADSYLNAASLAFYAGNIYDENRRLIGDDFSNGFVPGEAAVALLLGQPEPGIEQTCITGVGLGQEQSIIGSGEVLRADGLSDAIRNAAADAGTQVSETDFRIASANGEEYWFREASLAQSRTLEQKRPSHPLWHPADNIGEVGAAVGGAMLVMAHYAFEKYYAPGPKALCHISNDNEDRVAFIVERVPA